MHQAILIKTLFFILIVACSSLLIAQREENKRENIEITKIKVKNFFKATRTSTITTAKKKKPFFKVNRNTKKQLLIEFHRHKQNKKKKVNIEINQLFVELMNNNEIIHVDNRMEYHLVLQKQVLYLQLHNQFVSLVHDSLGHELIL